MGGAPETVPRLSFGKDSDMPLKNYEYNGGTYQFDDSDVPDGAVEVKEARPANKSATPSNKAVDDGDSKPAVSRKR